MGESDACISDYDSLLLCILIVGFVVDTMRGLGLAVVVSLSVSLILKRKKGRGERVWRI